MNKKVFNLWLFAALLCGLSLTVTSCKDDDDNEPSAEEQEQQALEQAEQEMMFFNVLDYLADMSNAPADFLTGSYEPTIGVADGGNESIRIVNTNDMATAAMRFADLAGASIDENTQTFTWSDDKVGTLTYTKTNDGKSWATVDVSIKQIPHLSKIIYRSPEQADNNGKFDGTAYYRFGDVVKKTNADGEDEFWICVRPAFGPEGKEDSHWVTVCPLPKSNVWTYKGSNNIDYALPTKLGDNHEHSQNFAEMLFAIFFPQEWENNVLNTKGITMFHDFDKENIMYHRQYFWQRVQKAWTDPKALTNAYGNLSGISLLKYLFGTDGTEEYFKTMLKSADGLNLLTNGYSWNTTFSNKPTLYRYRFVNGTGKESNMHKEPIKGGVFSNYHSVSAEVIKAKITLNCIKDYSTVTPGWKVSNFFGTENKHYIIRHATGAELSTDKKEDAKKALTGVTEVYRYNKYYSITDLDEDPEVLDRSTGRIVNDVAKQKWSHYRGEPHYRFGDIYEDQYGHTWMVLNLAGSHCDLKTNGHHWLLGDSACYTELISFKGLQTIKGNKDKFDNLPTRDQVMRALPILQYLQMHYGKSLKKDPLLPEDYKVMGQTLLQQIQVCNFDFRMLFQILRAQQESYWDRGPSYVASCAYNDPTDTSGKQRLLRFIANYQNPNNNSHYFFSEHYVENPDSTTELYASSRYGNVPIYLQDIAQQDMVAKYAEDSYARMPFFSTDNWKNNADNTVYRKPRSKADATAKDVTNYIYNWEKWQNRTFPGDMWNEPILIFRMTAVYDRGATEYATKTVDGLELKPRMIRDWIRDDGYDNWDDFLTTYSTWISVMCNDMENFWLDGKRIDWPDPFKTWSNK